MVVFIRNHAAKCRGHLSGSKDMTGFIIGIVVAAVAVVASLLVSAVVNRKQDRLFDEMYRDEAVIQSKCMVREGAVHAPGVAQIIDGTLIIRNVLGWSLETPLEEVELKKQTIGIGWLPWIGKAIFKLKTPETIMLAIGVSRAQARSWREALQSR